ncbi:MAG: hypothetical protein GF375_04175, partial [Candidatus Omnitrophica bacterium]|nr:hypothetical protein [Candidatus Omnitrophota bacterium]MBD3269246.1 hypothetical protein [Candidatus Omnitrophota bacterium]
MYYKKKINFFRLFSFFLSRISSKLSKNYKQYNLFVSSLPKPSQARPRTVGLMSFSLLVLCLVFSTALAGFAESPGQSKDIGMAVSPGQIWIQNVAPGEAFDVGRDMGVELIIANNSDKKRIYLLSVNSGGDISAESIKGYLPLPDINWVRLKKQSVEVLPQEKEKVNVFINIPDREEYYNQRWFAKVKVSSKPQKYETLALGITSTFYIETESKYDLKQKPYGTFGVIPSEVVINPLKVGEDKDS